MKKPTRKWDGFWIGKDSGRIFSLVPTFLWSFSHWIETFAASDIKRLQFMYVFVAYREIVVATIMQMNYNGMAPLQLISLKDVSGSFPVFVSQLIHLFKISKHKFPSFASWGENKCAVLSFQCSILCSWKSCSYKWIIQQSYMSTIRVPTWWACIVINKRGYVSIKCDNFQSRWAQSEQCFLAWNSIGSN